MNKFLLLLIPLMLASLACLETSITPEAPTQTARPAATQTEEPSGEMFLIPIGVTTTTPPRCALVSATVAVNLRTGSSTEEIVIRALRNGELVTIHKTVAGWSAVTTSQDEQGYVKAEYLTESECR